jgi:hypothetical protein
LFARTTRKTRLSNYSVLFAERHRYLQSADGQETRHLAQGPAGVAGDADEVCRGDEGGE